VHIVKVFHRPEQREGAGLIQAKAYDSEGAYWVYSSWDWNP